MRFVVPVDSVKRAKFDCFSGETYPCIDCPACATNSRRSTDGLATFDRVF